MKQNNLLSPLVLSVVAAASLTASAVPADPGAVGRGMNVAPQASGCNIGPFPQTTKAGAYNVLCNIMQDSEKCLALVKRQFRFDGTNVTVHPVSNASEPRMAYCLDVLRSSLLVPGETQDLAE